VLELALLLGRSAGTIDRADIVHGCVFLRFPRLGVGAGHALLAICVLERVQVDVSGCSNLGRLFRRDFLDKAGLAEKGVGERVGAKSSGRCEKASAGGHCEKQKRGPVCGKEWRRGCRSQGGGID
jgi:hypothetical protein